MADDLLDWMARQRMGMMSVGGVSGEGEKKEREKDEKQRARTSKQADPFLKIFSNGLQVTVQWSKTASFKKGCSHPPQAMTTSARGEFLSSILACLLYF